MRIDDYHMLLALGLLSCDQAHFEKTIAELKTEDDGYDYQNPMAPKARSVGGIGISEKPEGLLDWVTGLRNNGPLTVRYHKLEDEAGGDLPPRAAAAFANGERKILQVTSPKGTETYAFRTYFSSRFAMSLPEFCKLVNAQNRSQEIWDKIWKKTNESNSMNNRPEVPRAEIESYLVAGEGRDVMNFLIEDFLSSMQKHLRGQGENVVLPPGYEKFVGTTDPDQMELEYLRRTDPDSVAEFIPSEDRYYFDDAVTPQMYVDFVNAHSCRADIWRRVADRMNMFAEEDGKAPVMPDQAEAILAGMSKDDFMNLGSSSYIGDIQRSCKRNGVAFVIPPDLKKHMKSMTGANDPDLAKSYIPERERLRLIPNPEPWEFYAFVYLEGFPAMPTVADLKAIETEYIQALKKTEEFAVKAKSPFAEAFKLARFVLETKDIPLHARDIESVEVGAEKLKDLGFSEQAERVFTGEFGILVSLVRYFDWPEAKTRRLASAAIANVFGGMGSWNDQGFEDEKMHKEYEAVSDRMFSALQKFTELAWNA